MLGPLGISLVNQVKQSRALTSALLPLANALARASGHRQLGLKYDDLIIEEREDVAKALGRLSPQESYDRAYRIRRAVQQSVQHKNLSKDQWVKPDEDKPYLKPIVEEVVKEDQERKYWDTVEATPTRK